jgi:Holliday junction resolvasome RuvABC endonuclease subunit
MRQRTRQVVGRASNVIGLDISLKGPGICIASGSPRARVDHGLIVESTLIRAGEDTRGPERLSVVSRAVYAWMVSRGCGLAGDLYVTEGYAFGSQQAHSLGEMGGCIRKAIWESGGNLIVIPPPTLKKFMTGAGSGDKNIVMKHVFKRWSFDVDDDNQCDAFGCAVLGLVDQCGDEIWTAIERDILTKKVQRYAGKGQTNWASTTNKKVRKVRKQAW